MMEEMLEQGIIQPSQSTWASTIVLVAKKDETTKFCVDYRRLNAITKLDVIPGYWQVSMLRESVEKTAFATHSGLYKFAVMLFLVMQHPSYIPATH